MPCFVKQLGSRPVDGGSPMPLADSHGGDWEEWPRDLRVRQCPENHIPSLMEEEHADAR